ncbi:transcriptional regulator domain-containing protein [Caulobacter sp. RHG1]|uniref:transcriptional regulator domain-containing protein n=1 Tax=Caulobacter sp. (strain RHG1) TaxID=2545762 RepID=UPI001F509E2C|nr:DUF6499 domain-containing protein [Caulobacter sp. RHG1]
MPPDALPIEDWRNTAAYDYLDTLTPSALAWECLRRNQAYNADLHALQSPSAPSQTEVAGRWGLRFPIPRHHDRPGPGDRLDPEIRSFDPPLRPRAQRTGPRTHDQRPAAFAEPPRAGA